MCNSRGLLRLPSPANMSGSGREILLAPNQICYQIVQFLDLVNIRLARNGPVWAQRGSADEVTENQRMCSLIYTHTHTRKLTLCLYLSDMHTDAFLTHAALCLHFKLFPSSIAQWAGDFFPLHITYNSSELQCCVLNLAALICELYDACGSFAHILWAG